MKSQLLSTERWNRAQEIFWAAAELPLAEQAALVEEASGGDPEVRAEVESLLRHDRSGNGDEAVVDAIGSEAAVLLQDSQILGARLGDYRVIREIGQGGMGTVYLAE